VLRSGLIVLMILYVTLSSSVELNHYSEQVKLQNESIVKGGCRSGVFLSGRAIILEVFVASERHCL
jgi:hypothetical protein